MWKKNGDERGICVNMFEVQLTGKYLKKLNTFAPEKFLCSSRTSPVSDSECLTQVIFIYGASGLLHPQLDVFASK